jgi:hypothetical protein
MKELNDGNPTKLMMTALDKQRLPLYLFLIVGLLQSYAPAAAQSDLRAVIDGASGERIHADVYELASERYRGRATGTAEMMEASMFVRDQMAALGLLPVVGDTSYFQYYTVDYNEIWVPSHLRAKKEGGSVIELRLLEDYSPHAYSGSGTFSNAPLTVISASAANGELGRVTGSVVLYLPPDTYEHTAGMNAFEIRQLPGEHLYEVALRLKAAGAVAMIVPGSIYGRIGTRAVVGLPILAVTAEALQRVLDEDSGSGISISGRVASTLFRDQIAANVVALLRGSDPSLADEVVIVGAHTDHVGTIAGIIHPGAHDNASGTAVMIEVARMFAEAAVGGMRPRRSVLFAGFSGEEMGLLGSRHYVENDPLFPLDKTTAMVNLDILGGGNGYMMVGALNFPEYYNLVAEINERYFGLEIRRRDNAPNSDHFYFGLAGIPAAFFYALEGPPVGIHSPTDVAEAMDPDFMAQSAQLAFATAWYVANLEPEAALRLRQTAP